jgi:CPW-WPC domain-containing protein
MAKLWVLIILVPIVEFSGCGPNLTRPGWKPPPDEKPKNATEQFLEAQADLLARLTFHFDYLNYSPLSGVKKEIMRVIAKYPPHMVGGSPRITSLHVDQLCDRMFKNYLTEKAGFQPHDIECARDYSQLCPPRWADLGDGETCEGPPSMFENEECRTVKFGGMTPVEKSEAAFKCGETKFPCLDECLVREYDETCPERWTPVPGTSKCVAPPDYVKPCIKVYDFQDHKPHLKRKFEEICKVNWKCKTPPPSAFGNINKHSR